MSHVEIERPPGRFDVADDLETFFEVSLDLLCIRALDGSVVKVSRSWETILGWRHGEIEGTQLLRLVHPEDLPGTQDSAREVEGRRPHDPILGHVNRYRHKNGTYRTVEWRAQRHGDRIYAVARDVTDRLAAERDLLEAKQAAEAASRAKSEFLANMSHEIRTPLNGVIGVVDALARTDLSPVQQELVELVRSSGESLERLVSDLLDVSKIEAGRLELEIRPFDLSEAIDGPLQMLSVKAAEKGLVFEVARGDEAHGWFLGDALRVRQVLTNLLSNAVKFTQVGGVAVQIDVEDGTPDPVLVVDVEDTGVGFSSEAAATLFDRFTQADGSITRRFGGTGLGLAICRSLMDVMGGTISATSTPGVGSRFSIRLPLTRTLAGRDEAEAPAMPDRALRVLVAEDHPVNQKVVRLILDAHDCETTMVGDGREAVAAYREGGWDVVLMDMQMPEMDGLAATRAIRAIEGAGARTPVIMLSANAMEAHRHEALAAGADMHLSKPITAAALMDGIARATGQSQ
jgi:PAS domain S-box-containing protein